MKEGKKILKLSKFRIGDHVYFYNDGGCIRVEVLDVYMINNMWYYELDCNNYQQGMVLEYVSENYLGFGTKPKKHNEIFSSRKMSEFADMVLY